RRARAPLENPAELCVVVGCTRLTQRSSRRGLSEVLCKRHSEHLRSHGHETRKSYSKAELTPSRKAAIIWFNAHRDRPEVGHAITNLGALMASQGRSKDAYHQRSMNPKEKARNVLARLREAGKTGEQLFLIVLAVKATHKKLGPWGKPDWIPVQIAKQAKKLRGASGTHYRNGPYRLPSRYPRGEGLYMRHLGRMIEERAAIAIQDKTLAEVCALAED
ncbi:hypothetical protein DRY87_25080, partial [Salmonella enterica subsp. enterica serovar Newport]|nr:hypothetical protein [Salmonella enterica subsp. enterica serovar Newport]